jgi:hypothetical protein
MLKAPRQQLLLLSLLVLLLVVLLVLLLLLLLVLSCEHPCAAAHLLLGHLQGALVPANLQQLHDTALIGSKASNLAHDVAHELNLLAQVLQQPCKAWFI